MKTRIAIVTGAVLATSTDATFAQGDRGLGGRGGPPAQAGPGPANLFDPDRNGVLTKSEIAKASEILARYDRNRDGQVTADDFGASSQRGPGGGPQRRNP